MIFCPEELCDLRNDVTDGSIENYELDWARQSLFCPRSCPWMKH